MVAYFIYRIFWNSDHDIVHHLKTFPPPCINIHFRSVTHMGWALIHFNLISCLEKLLAKNGCYIMKNISENDILLFMLWRINHKPIRPSHWWHQWPKVKGWGGERMVGDWGVGMPKILCHALFLSVKDHFLIVCTPLFSQDMHSLCR